MAKKNKEPIQYFFLLIS